MYASAPSWTECCNELETASLDGMCIFLRHVSGWSLPHGFSCWRVREGTALSLEVEDGGLASLHAQTTGTGKGGWAQVPWAAGTGRQLGREGRDLSKEVRKESVKQAKDWLTTPESFKEGSVRGRFSLSQGCTLLPAPSCPLTFWGAPRWRLDLLVFPSILVSRSLTSLLFFTVLHFWPFEPNC